MKEVRQLTQLRSTCYFYFIVSAIMAVAIGFSVGDLLALTKVTSKVVSELKEVGSLKADLEF